MSQHAVAAPNPTVRETYERLGSLLEEGDDVFIERGPAVLRDALEEPGFFDGVDTEHAEQGEYTRRKVVGEPGEHVIRFMEWPPGYALCPHEHHGRPCFEVLVDGLLSIVDFEAERIDGGENESPDGEALFELSTCGTHTTEPGEAAVVDPRENEIHAVYSPVRSRSLHVYPEDNAAAHGYVPHESEPEAPAPERDVFVRERFELDE